MNFKRIFIVIGLCGILEQGFAAPKAAKYDIYSWKNGNEWEYSVIPASAGTEQAAVQIKREGGPLRGISKVKEKLLTFNAGDQISWRERRESGLVYPPDLVIEDLKGYAQSVGVKLEKFRKKP